MLPEDVKNANSLGLFNSLADILNSGKRDSDYAIARYLTAHIGGIHAMSITDIMAEAYVTRSAVRRFCNRVGFSSFSEIREYVTVASYPSDLNHRDLEADISSYRADLDKSIVAMLAELADVVGDEAIIELARQMREHDHVVLVCANNTSGVLGRFQQELFYASKVVFLVSDTYHERLSDLPAVGTKLLVVVSASGVFAHSIESWIGEVEADRWLITANPSSVDATHYDHILCLSRDSVGHDRLGLIGKYGVSYLFDLLSACYLHAYARA